MLYKIHFFGGGASAAKKIEYVLEFDMYIQFTPYIMIKLNDFWKNILREIVENFGCEKYKFFVKENTNVFAPQNDYYVDIENFCKLIEWYIDDEEKLKAIMKYSNMEYDNINSLNLHKILNPNKGKWWDNIVTPSLYKKEIGYIDYVGEYIDDTNEIECNSIMMKPYIISKLGSPDTYYSFMVHMIEKPIFKNAAAYED